MVLSPSLCDKGIRTLGSSTCGTHALITNSPKQSNHDFLKCSKWPVNRPVYCFDEVGTSLHLVPTFQSKESKTGVAEGGFGAVRDPPGIPRAALLAGL